MKKIKRVISLVLATLMLLGILPMTVSATKPSDAVLGTQNFESVSGTKVTGSDGFAAVPNHQIVANLESNKFLRIPFQGAEGASGQDTNWDSSLQVKHAAPASGNSFVLEVDYRPHYGGNGSPTLEAQFRRYTFTDKDGKVHTGGQYFNLFKINVKTGHLQNCGTVVDGAEGMKLDQWNTLKLEFFPVEGAYKIYINGKLYSENNAIAAQEYSGGWVSYPNATDIVVSSDQFIVAKCNKNSGAYTSTLGSQTTYVDVDNIKVFEMPKVTVTLDGKDVQVAAGAPLELVTPGKQLLYAEIKDGESTYTTRETSVAAKGGMIITTRALEIKTYATSARAGSPLGLRFETKLNRADFEALKADANVKSIKLGTVILPTLSLKAAASYEKAELSAGSYLDVAATEGEWYKSDSDYDYFAGSIINVKAHNVSTAFSGYGYAEVTLKDGTVICLNGVTDKSTIPSSDLALASKVFLETAPADLHAGVKKALEGFADQFVGDRTEMYQQSMNGLNVLAIGDSLFWGTVGQTRAHQWVNLMGAQCGWNLTNLGISGATVSLTDKNATANKQSMYQNLVGSADYKWGTASGDYFTVGKPSGDPADVDLILFEGANNDYGYAIAAPLGTTASKDPGTLLGAWNLMTEILLERYPNATIVFITPWELPGSQTRPDNMASIPYTRSIITLYNEVYKNNDRVCLINAGDPAVSGVDMANGTWKNTYSTDSYHLKDSGMEIMAENMLPLIWNIAVNKAN